MIRYKWHYVMLRTLDYKMQSHLHVYTCIIIAKGVTWRKEKKRVKVDLVLFIDRPPSRKKSIGYHTRHFLCYVMLGVQYSIRANKS